VIKTETTRAARLVDELRAVSDADDGSSWNAGLMGEAADLLDEAAAALREMMTATGPICGLDPAEVIDARERARAVLAALNGETPR
jgi:hypothetical protein